MVRSPLRDRRGRQQPEERFEHWVIELAALYGWRGYKTRKSFGVVMGVSKADAYGWPDGVFWHPRKHRFLLRELKAEAGVVRPDQKRVIAELQACGVDAKVWWPADRDEIVETFAA